MNRQAGAILEQAGEYAARFERVSGAFGEDVSSAGPVRLSSDRELLDGLAQLSGMIRLLEGERVRLAGDVARRSAIGDDSSLARRMGALSAAALVAERAFLPRSAAGALVRLGEAVRPREGLTGELLPAAHPHLAAAVEAGTLPTGLAGAMLTCLTRLDRSLTREELAELEVQLVAALDEGWTVDQLTAWLKKVPEVVDPDLAKPREDNLRALAKITEVALESGLTRFILDLDPETAGLFKTAMDAGASLRRPGPVFVEEGSGADEDMSEAEAAAEQADRRPVRERRVDGLRLMATRALKADDGETGGTAVTMVVTATEEALRTGVGSATIDGIDAPISARTAQLLMAGAEMLAVLLGDGGEVLDYGPTRRLFSQGQRRAMGARDMGCVGPGCRAPLSACEGAHIRPHGYGNTAVDNGVMLCWHCHRLMDLHGWQISRDKGRWWWTPPPWVDPFGRRRPGGRIPPPSPPSAGPFGPQRSRQ